MRLRASDNFANGRAIEKINIVEILCTNLGIPCYSCCCCTFPSSCAWACVKNVIIGVIPKVKHVAEAE